MIGISDGSDAGRDSDRRRLRRAVKADGRACGAKIRLRFFQRLVGWIDLRLECVELRVVEQGPPVALQSSVAGLRRLPTILGFEVIGQRLLEFRCNWSRWAHVLRPDPAAREHEAQQGAWQKHSRPPGPDRDRDHDWPPALELCGYTSMPLVSESEGSRMTSSAGDRPEMISTELPKSWPMVTGTSRTRSPRTTPTRRPSARNSNVFDGIVTVCFSLPVAAGYSVWIWTS